MDTALDKPPSERGPPLPVAATSRWLEGVVPIRHFRFLFGEWADFFGEARGPGRGRVGAAVPAVRSLPCPCLRETRRKDETVGKLSKS